MKMNKQWILTTAMIGSVLVAGCDDPADDVAAATVVEEPAESAEAPPAPTADRETLAISNGGSEIAFVGSKADGSSHDGGFREWTGSIELDAQTPTNSSVQLTIQTASLFADDDRLTAHLKSDEFFDVEAFPTATFETSAIEEGGEGEATHTLVGRLTLHGQTQTIRVPATIGITEQAVRAESHFSINRSDFGITYPGQAENLIRERVVVKLDITAPRG